MQKIKRAAFSKCFIKVCVVDSICKSSYYFLILTTFFNQKDFKISIFIHEFIHSCFWNDVLTVCKISLLMQFIY